MEEWQVFPICKNGEISEHYKKLWAKWEDILVIDTATKATEYTFPSWSACEHFRRNRTPLSQPIHMVKHFQQHFI